MNSVTLIGNLGKDPEAKVTPSGKKVCNFSLATNDRNNVSWHNITAWEKTAELCEQYLSKGSKVGIQGRIQYRSWENENGVTQRATDIIVDRVEFLDSKKPGSDFDVSQSLIGEQAQRLTEEHGEVLPF